MICTAILARIFRVYGWDGIGLIFDLCAIFSFPIEFIWQFWKNLCEPDSTKKAAIVHPLDKES
jgi:hypothetical protein